jgi:MFS superfamily sulfate permease-like transporter
MAVAALWTAFWLFALFILWQWQPLPKNIPSYPALLDDIHFLCCKTLAIAFIVFLAVAGMWIFRNFNSLLGQFIRMRLPSTFSRPRLLPRIRSSVVNVVFLRYSQRLHELCE